MLLPMKYEVSWKSKYEFNGTVRQHALVMDAGAASGGDDHGPSPKELVLAAICGCTGMDVAGLMRKAKVSLGSLKITAEAEQTRGQPRVFEQVSLLFEATAEGEAAAAPLIDAVEKSQSLYCGVSAMIAASCPIVYRVIFNGKAVHEGKAHFQTESGA